MKWIGAILVVLGCGGVGFYMAFLYRRELQMLKQLDKMLEYMANELRYRQTALPQLIKSAAGNTGGILRNCFYELSVELDNQIAPDAASCMNAVLSRTKDMPKQVFGCLAQLGSTLGLFDLDGQLAGIASVQDECSRCIEEMEAGKQQRLRSYQTLGLCAGAALAILFV